MTFWTVTRRPALPFPHPADISLARKGRRSLVMALVQPSSLVADSCHTRPVLLRLNTPQTVTQVLRSEVEWTWTDFSRNWMTPGVR